MDGHRALARDRGDRYPSARSFAEALEEIVRRRRLQMGPAPLVRLLERLEPKAIEEERLRP
jgi:hypothetical protein